MTIAAPKSLVYDPHETSSQALVAAPGRDDASGVRSMVVAALVLGASAGCGTKERSSSPSIVALRDVQAPSGAIGSATAHPQGCTHGLIEGSDVCDTSDARAAIAVCEAYRAAVESHDVPALLDLASQDYDDGAGTVDTDDDVTRPDLERYLEHEFPKANAIRFEIRYRKVERGALIRVSYSYVAAFRVGSVWQRKVDDSTLVLRRESGRLRIVSGM